MTFSNVLNMVTGTEGEDEGVFSVPFILASSAEEGIKAISNLKDLPEAPGEKFKYASTHTSGLSYAMQKYVEKEEGKAIYYWDIVLENVVNPLKVDYLALQHTEESDGSKRIPITAWGDFLTIDETAKIALLSSNEGKYENPQFKT